MPQVKEIPGFIVKLYGTARKFRQGKRRALRKTLSALSDLTIGCAHTPAYGSIKIARDALNAAEVELSIENWGR